MARYFRWVRKASRVGRSGRFGLVWSGLVWRALNSTQSLTDKGGHRAARAAKKSLIQIFNSCFTSLWAKQSRWLALGSMGEALKRIESKTGLTETDSLDPLPGLRGFAKSLKPNQLYIGEK